MKPAVEDSVSLPEPSVVLESAFAILSGDDRGKKDLPESVKFEKARVHGDRPTKASWLGLDDLSWLEPHSAIAKSWNKAMM